MKSCVYIDNHNCLDPASNLAMEEYALRHLDTERDYFLLYRNEPSVIVGRNQNILEEINDTYVRNKGIRVIRRLSGGGAVYHDPGNLNFSFVTRYKQSLLHNFRYFNKPVVAVLRDLGVPAGMNDRNDILADGRKISGNAQFSSRGRMFSHGTLLFDSNLDEVEESLAVKMNGIRSRSHKSVRSQVANISEFIREPMDIQQFHSLLLEGLRERGVVTGTCRLTHNQWKEIKKIRDQRYINWSWNMGRSPRFKVERSRTIGKNRVTVRVEVEKGVIHHLSLNSGSDFDPAPASATESIALLDDIRNRLTGLNYDPVEIDSVFEKIRDPSPENQYLISEVRQMIYGQ